MSRGLWIQFGRGFRSCYFCPKFLAERNAALVRVSSSLPRNEYVIYIYIFFLLDLGHICLYFLCLLTKSVLCFCLLWFLLHLNLSYVQWLTWTACLNFFNWYLVFCFFFSIGLRSPVYHVLSVFLIISYLYLVHLLSESVFPYTIYLWQVIYISIHLELLACNY